MDTEGFVKMVALAAGVGIIYLGLSRTIGKPSSPSVNVFIGYGDDHMHITSSFEKKVFTKSKNVDDGLHETVVAGGTYQVNVDELNS